jgi:hypothetical protein
MVHITVLFLMVQERRKVGQELPSPSHRQMIVQDSEIEVQQGVDA